MECVSAALEFQARKTQWKYDEIESVSSKSPPRFWWASWLSQNCGPARSLTPESHTEYPHAWSTRGRNFTLSGTANPPDWRPATRCQRHRKKNFDERTIGFPVPCR